MLDKEYYIEWKEIIETVARELGRGEQMVEKDTIQSMFLYELAKSELRKNLNTIAKTMPLWHGFCVLKKYDIFEHGAKMQ